MTKKKGVWSRELKISAVKRMLAGENTTALAKELKVRRTILYRWRDSYRKDGVRAFPGRAGRPPKSAQAIAGASICRRRKANCRVGTQDRPATGRTRFFSASLAASRGKRSWREGVYAVIETMTKSLPQGELTIERMCTLTALNRAGYYRHWRRSAPREEAMTVRDAIQRVALENRHYGYRRITRQLRREGVGREPQTRVAPDAAGQSAVFAQAVFCLR